MVSGIGESGGLRSRPEPGQGRFVVQRLQPLRDGLRKKRPAQPGFGQFHQYRGSQQGHGMNPVGQAEAPPFPGVPGHGVPGLPVGRLLPEIVGRLGNEDDRVAGFGGRPREVEYRFEGQPGMEPHVQDRNPQVFPQLPGVDIENNARAPRHDHLAPSGILLRQVLFDGDHFPNPVFRRNRGGYQQQ